jgi:hypothetical protein
MLTIVGGEARAQVATAPAPGLTTTAVEGPMAVGRGSVLYVDDWSRLEARTGHWLAFDGSRTHAQAPGGHLEVFSVADVDSLDPGYWYYRYDYMALGQTTQRWLYAWEPGKAAPTPDVAAGMPQTRDLSGLLCEVGVTDAALGAGKGHRDHATDGRSRW